MMVPPPERLIVPPEAAGSGIEGGAAGRCLRP